MHRAGVLMHAVPCGLLLGPTSEERTSIQNRMHITTSNTSHEGHSPLYNYYNSCMPLPSGRRISMPERALSQKCLSADATIQNRRHSEQVTTAEHKHVTAWRSRGKRTDAPAYYSLKLSTAPTTSFGVWSASEKMAHVWLGTASRVHPALRRQHQATSLGVAAGDGAEPGTARPTTTSD